MGNTSEFMRLVQAALDKGEDLFATGVERTITFQEGQPMAVQHLAETFAGELWTAANNKATAVTLCLSDGKPSTFTVDGEDHEFLRLPVQRPNVQLLIGNLCSAAGMSDADSSGRLSVAIAGTEICLTLTRGDDGGVLRITGF